MYGSSPRMRGARRVLQCIQSPMRIIPADAGSTSSRVCGTGWFRDHPRGCGEHPLLLWSLLRNVGSSPRMRGALSNGISRVSGVGIIPADAGSTMIFRVLPTLARDHPRGCGEHVFPQIDHDMQTGSSPRMRGAPQHA